MRNESQVGLWILPFLPGSCFPRAFLAALDAEEVKWCRALAREEDRYRFVVSRVLLRHALAVSSGTDPRSWEFARQPTGEWTIRRPVTTVAFSLAHAENVVAVVVSTGRRVGVDLESLRGLLTHHSLAAMFSAGELDWLARTPASSRPKESLRLWTAKEAYAKLTGRGSEADFSSVEMAPQPPTGCGLWESEIHVGGEPFLFSVAVESPPHARPSVSVRRLNVRDLEEAYAT